MSSETRVVCLIGAFLAVSLATPARAQQASQTTTPPTAPVHAKYPLDGVTGYDVPMDWSAQRTAGLPLIQMRVNGSTPLWFLLNIGYKGHIAISAHIATQLKMEKMPETQGTEFGTNTSGRVQVKTLEMATVSHRPVPFNVPWIYTTSLDMQDETHWPRPIAGIIGAQTFANMTLCLDYQQQRALLILSEHPSLAEANTGLTLPLRSVEGEAGDFVEWSPAAGKPPILVALRTDLWSSTLPPDIIRELSPKAAIPTSYMTAPNTSELVAQNWIPSLPFGPYTLSNVEVLGTKGRPTLGANILGRFRVILDYRRKQVTLEPTSRTASLNELSGRSGLQIRRQNRDLVIAFVSAIQPTLASLKGRKLVEIDGKSVAGITQAEAQFLLDGYANTEGRVRVSGASGKVTSQEVTFHRMNVYDAYDIEALHPTPHP